MIPIADLQIGNRVLYNGMEAIVYSIRGPYPDVSERFNNKPTVDLILGGMISATEDELEPIVLIEEILLKCGFNKDCDSYWIGYNDLRYYVMYRGWAQDWSFHLEYMDSPFYEDDGKKYAIAFDFKYFHELQNLFKLIIKKDIIP